LNGAYAQPASLDRFMTKAMQRRYLLVRHVVTNIAQSASETGILALAVKIFVASYWKPRRRL